MELGEKRRSPLKGDSSLCWGGGGGGQKESACQNVECASTKGDRCCEKEKADHNRLLRRDV